MFLCLFARLVNIPYYFSAKPSSALKFYWEHSRASSTRARYQGEIEKFEAATGDRRLVRSDAVCLNYLASVAQSRGKAAAKLARAALGMVREEYFLPPLSSPAFARLFTGIAKAQASPPQQKAPMSKKLLLRFLLRVYPLDSASFEDLRTFLLEFTMFSGLARFSDIASLSWSNLSLTKDAVVISCQKRKNDQKLTRQLFIRLPPSRHFDVGKAFKTLRSKSKSGFIFAESSAPGSAAVSYKSAWRCQKAWLARLGVDSSKYGLHSGRVGGIQFLANNGVRLEDIGRLAGYAPNSSSPGYYARNATLASAKCRSLLKL